jgi:predicted AAA+ superfamily ATPase
LRGTKDIANDIYYGKMNNGEMKKEKSIVEKINFSSRFGVMGL